VRVQELAQSGGVDAVVFFRCSPGRDSGRSRPRSGWPGRQGAPCSRRTSIFAEDTPTSGRPLTSLGPDSTKRSLSEGTWLNRRQRGPMRRAEAAQGILLGRELAGQCRRSLWRPRPPWWFRPVPLRCLHLFLPRVERSSIHECAQRAKESRCAGSTTSQVSRGMEASLSSCGQGSHGDALLEGGN